MSQVLELQKVLGSLGVQGSQEVQDCKEELQVVLLGMWAEMMALEDQ